MDIERLDLCAECEDAWRTIRSHCAQTCDDCGAYEIVTTTAEDYAANGRSANWDNDTIGDENKFETIEEAEATITELQALGPEWGAAVYAVREIGELHPLYHTIVEPDDIPEEAE